MNPGQKKKKGTSHECPICKVYGHHWKNCKECDPAAKEALQALAANMKAEKEGHKESNSSNFGYLWSSIFLS
jgi:hypothetical protein